MNIEIYILLGLSTVVVVGFGWILKELKNMAVSLDNLNAAIADLTLAVDDLVVVFGGVPEADVQAAADLVVIQTARIRALQATPPVP